MKLPHSPCLPHPPLLPLTPLAPLTPQGLRLPHIFLISEVNCYPILMRDHSFRSLEPLQEYEVT